MADASGQPHPFVRLALEAIALHLCESRTLTPPDGLLEQEPTFRRRAGVFVSVIAREALRGCVGTIKPERENLALEIIDAAISAAGRDPRFRPVTPEELSELRVRVYVLNPPERVAGLVGLDPAQYGIIVQNGSKRGVLLPGVDGIASVETQLALARRKAGIGEYDPVELYRFAVERYH